MESSLRTAMNDLQKQEESAAAELARVNERADSLLTEVKSLREEKTALSGELQALKEDASQGLASANKELEALGELAVAEIGQLGQAVKELRERNEKQQSTITRLEEKLKKSKKRASKRRPSINSDHASVSSDTTEHSAQEDSLSQAVKRRTSNSGWGVFSGNDANEEDNIDLNALKRMDDSARSMRAKAKNTGEQEKSQSSSPWAMFTGGSD